MKYFFQAFIILFCVSNTFSQGKLERPKLVVGIVVDQMRNDYMFRYYDKYSEDGFKRLMRDGFYCKNNHFSYMPTYTGPGHASVYTGTTPAYHGIIANDWFDKETGTEVYCSSDETCFTVGAENSDGKMSPSRMLSTSITDELRLSTNFKSKVLGVAIKDRGSILPAGHLANAAYWLSGGDFISSTYYMKDLPAWVSKFNDEDRVEAFINGGWNTLLPIEEYTESIADDNKYEGVFQGEEKPVFPHDLQSLYARNKDLGMIRSTPFGNTLVTDFAIEALKNEEMGKDAACDFLALSYSSPDYIGHIYGNRSIESQDNYLRLDLEIARFLKYLDDEIGEGNYLVFLTADHGSADVPSYFMDNKVPAGYLDLNTMETELIDYMKSEYDLAASAIRSFSNYQLFFEYDSLRAKSVNPAAFYSDIARFLRNYPGIYNAVSADVIRENYYAEGVMAALNRGYNPQRSGDVLLIPQADWLYYGPVGTSHGSPYSYDTHVPLIFYGWNVEPGVTHQRTEIRDIASTLSMLLNISLTSGNTGNPILPLLEK